MILIIVANGWLAAETITYMCYHLIVSNAVRRSPQQTRSACYLPDPSNSSSQVKFVQHSYRVRLFLLPSTLCRCLQETHIVPNI